MPAIQRRVDEDGLEIAVSDVPRGRESGTSFGSVALLPTAGGAGLLGEDGGEGSCELEVDEGMILLGDEGDELPPADHAGEDELLEPSDAIEVEAARSGAGLGPLPGEALEAEEDPCARTEVDRPCPVDLSAETLVDGDIHAIADDEDPAEGEAAEDAKVEPAEAGPVAALPARAPRSRDPIRVPLWSGLNSFVYSVVRGLRGMGQSPLVQLLAIGTMAVCMVLLGTATLIFQNAQAVAQDLGIDRPVTVYMEPAADEASAALLRERLEALPEVESAQRVTPEMALARLQDGLGQGADFDDERAELLAGVDASYLPDSIELSLVEGVEPGFADALAERVGTMEGVEEVAVMGPWVQQVERMLSTMQWLAIGVGALVSLACLAIVWSTIRLGVFARRSEIDILRVVGGTARFVRGPFVVEGVLQGVLGTALALASLWVIFELIRPFLERGMSLMFAAGSLRFFTEIEMGVALAFGALLGVIGSRAAVARHAEA